MSKPIIEKMIVIDAAPGDLFAALTEPNRIVRVFPFRAVEIEPRVGGAIVFHGVSDGVPFTDSGTIAQFDPPRLFEYRYWSDNHATVRSPETEVVLRYTLETEADGKTRLSVTHSQLPSLEYAQMMDGAWDHLLAGLAAAFAP